MKVLVSFFLVAILSGCEIEYGEIDPPTKPSSVPESALWTGGPDGGVFVDIFSTKRKNIYKGTIYTDVTGIVIYQGEFKYTGEHKFDYKNRFSYGAWDGDYLFLRNNEKLIAIYPKKT